MKTNHEWTRIDKKTDGVPSTTSGAKMRLQSCALGVTMSWDDGFPGARASRPHQAWHSLGHLPHLDQPGTASWLSPPQGAQCDQEFLNQGSTHAQRRDRTPGTLFRDLGVTSCILLITSVSFVPLRGFLFPLSVFLRGPSRTPFESFPTPWSPFADPLARPLADPS